MPDKKPRGPDRVPDARTDLLYKLLETELGGVQVYRTALQCVVHPELRTEWARYLAETERHVVIARELLVALDLDPDAEVPARVIARHLGQGLVDAMLEAMASSPELAAELVACACVVTAETHDHANWELIGKLAKQTDGDDGTALRVAYEAVAPDEDRHLHRSGEWARELWAEALDIPAALPPQEAP